MANFPVFLPSACLPEPILHFVPHQLNTLSAWQLNVFSLFRKWWWVFYVTNSCSFSWMRRSGSGTEMQGSSTSKSREPLMFLLHYWGFWRSCSRMNQLLSAAWEWRECCSGIAPVLFCRSKGFLLGWLTWHWKGLWIGFLKALLFTALFIKVCLELWWISRFSEETQLLWKLSISHTDLWYIYLIFASQE